MNDILTYVVKYFTTDDATTRTVRVLVEDGYSTFSDIPSIIALRHYGHPGNAGKVVVLRLALKQD